MYIPIYAKYICKMHTVFEIFPTNKNIFGQALYLEPYITLSMIMHCHIIYSIELCK